MRAKSSFRRASPDAVDAALSTVVGARIRLVFWLCGAKAFAQAKQQPSIVNREKRLSMVFMIDVILLTR